MGMSLTGHIACGGVSLCENYASTRTIIAANTPLTYECGLIYGFPHRSRTHCPSRGPLVLTDRIEFPRNPPSHPHIIFNRAITWDYCSIMNDFGTSNRMILYFEVRSKDLVILIIASIFVRSLQCSVEQNRII